MSMAAKTHWIILRATAVAAIPLCVWFVYSVVHLAGADYSTFTGWLHYPGNAILIIAFVIVTFWHAALGVQEIIEDYVHAETLKHATMLLFNTAFVALGTACVFSVCKIAFMGGE